MNPQTRALRGAVRAYQLIASPVLGGQCRFYPSCSAYAMEALATHGAARGSLMAAKRVFRCHPWHPGGIDPVPPADTHPADTTKDEMTLHG
jgi:putative membrane protein insertion efficiency factor